MSSTPSIAIVIVTFNRLALLPRVLDSVFALRHPSFRVVLIDNASTDGTAEWLREISGYWNDSRLKYVRLAENTGGAGGFHAGLAEAMKTDCEWMFLMDDDVEILPDALENCLKYSVHSDCLHGSKLCLDGSRFSWEGLYETKLAYFTWYGERFAARKEFTVVNYGCFEGMFIHRRLVEKIGLPDPRFFIVLDDHVYGMRASLHTNVLYFRDVTLKKLLPVPRRWGEKSLVPYYLTRNRFFLMDFLKEHFPEAKLPIIRVFFFILLLRDLAQGLRERNLFRLKLLWKGYRDGLSRRGGRGLT